MKLTILEYHSQRFAVAFSEHNNAFKDAHGSYDIQGARHIVLNQCISQNFCVGGREWTEYLLTPKRQNPISIERLKELPSEYLNAIKPLNYRGSGWSPKRYLIRSQHTERNGDSTR